MATKAFQRVIAAVLLICICALLFCACGEAETPTTDPANGTTNSGSDTQQTGGGSDGQTSDQGSGLAFALTSDGASYEVTGIGSVTATDIVIPATYNGKPVTAIAARAFKYNTKMTSLTIPDSVTVIGDYALMKCSGLTSVTFGSGVTSINFGAFYGCEGLTSVTIPNSVTTIGEGAFYACTRLTSVTVGTGVTSIGGWAFADCTKLVEVYNLSHLTVEPGSEDENCLGYYAKVVHTALSEPSILTSTSDGYLFCYVDGAGYLIGYTGSETNLVLPDSFAYNGVTVTTYAIDAEAFYRNDQLLSVTIPGSVTSIGTSAFADCSGLTSVTIPGSVTSIGKWAFEYCNKLVEVYNLSSLTIVPGSEDDSSLGDYVKVVHTDLSEPSILTTTADGYIFYSLSGENALLGYSGSATDLVLPGSFEYSGAAVTAYEIYQGAFYRDERITSVTIPDSVTSIGENAFYGSSALISVTIGNGVTSIGEEAFSHCTGLTSLTLGRSVESIGLSAFWICEKLVEVYNLSGIDITVGSLVTNHDGCIGQSAKVVHTSLSEPSVLTMTADGYIFYSLSGENALLGYSESAADLVLPSSFAYNGATVTTYEIYQYAFYQSSLTSVTIPASVTKIGDDAFGACQSLTSVVIPDSVTSIGDWAFEYCYALTSLTIGNNVKSIGHMAFAECTGLTTLTIPDSVTSIGENAFCYCEGLTSVTFGSGLTIIGDKAFQGCTGLTSVAIPNSVTCIGKQAFSGCTGLASVTIPNSVTSIGAMAFSECTALTSVTIPDSVTCIGKQAFEDCTNLTAVNIVTTGWYYTSDSTATSGTDVDLSDVATAATYLTDTYSNYLFRRNG